MTRLFLLEPARAPAWAPFAGVRPVAELRAGVWLIRERWEASLGVTATGILDGELVGFRDVATPPVLTAAAVTGPAIVVRSDFIPARTAITHDPAPCRFTHEDTTVGWILPEGALFDPHSTAGSVQPVSGHQLHGSADLVGALDQLLGSDCAEFTLAASDPVPDGSVILGDTGQVVCLGAEVEPGVVFDVRRGAVVLTEGSQVRSGTRLEGPLFVGPATHILGGKVRDSSFGPGCRVHGEVSNTVIVGYSNKSHDGFVGHCVIGQWVNLGAGTITSNLKNTYGPIRLDLPSGRIETSRQFLGSMIADHAKTAIGTLLGAGTVIGAGANVFGTGTVPKYFPPFAWGYDGTERLGLEGFLRIAGRVLPRRGVEVTEELEESLKSLYSRHAP